MLALISLGFALTLGPMGPALTGQMGPSMMTASARAPAPVALFGWGGGGKKEEAPAAPGLSARDADFARRQDKLAARQVETRQHTPGQVARRCACPVGPLLPN